MDVIAVPLKEGLAAKEAAGDGHSHIEQGDGEGH